MIEFREGQDKIYLSKHKLTKDKFDDRWLNLHLIYSKDEKSSYDNKYVRIITFKNEYDLEFIKNVVINKFTDSYEEDFDFIYFEDYGYEYDKKTF